MTAVYGAGRRRGYTLVELIAGLGAASVLTIGIASTILISNTAMDQDTTTRLRTVAADTQTSLLSDLRHATAFKERTSNSVTIVVPDRTGDGMPDCIRYAWSGTPGDPLTYAINGSAAQTLVADVHEFDLAYQTETIVAPVIPLEGEQAFAGNVMFVSGGTFTEESSQGGLQSLMKALSGETTQSSAVDFNVSTSNVEDERIALLEAWGYTVNKISSTQPEADFQAALAEADVIYVSPEPTAAAALGWIQGSSLGIVNECTAIVDGLGFAESTTSGTGSSVTITGTPHFVTEDFTAGADVSIFSADQAVTGVSGTLAPDLTVAATVEASGTLPGLVTLDAAASKYGGGVTKGRRVMLPTSFPGASLANLTDDGQMLICRAVEWANGSGNDAGSNSENFGNDAIYASNAKIRRVQLATQVQLAKPGTLQSLSVHLGARDDLFAVAIYSDNGGEPDQLLAESALTMSSASGGWHTVDVPDTALTAGTYWLAVCVNDRNQALSYQSGGAYRQNNNNVIDHGFLSSWTSSNDTKDWDLSIYGTYTPD